MLLVGIASAPAHAENFRAQQWHLDAMGAEEIWQLSTGKGVTVAVIDSGVDKSNPDLRGQVLEGKDLATDESGDQFTDYTGHGTGMAGLIAGTGDRDGGTGAFGLAPGAKILPIRVSGLDAGGGSMADSDAEFNRVVPPAIKYAADSGAKVINVSLGAGAGSQALTDAVKYALDKGSLIFASTGNTADKGNQVEYPAATPGVVGIGAVDDKAKHVSTSQYGSQVDMVAPGKDMVHACGGGTGMCKSTGTSDATALASAAAALLWSKHPDWTNNQVLKVMLDTAAKPKGGESRSDYIGFGAIRPLRTLKTPGDPGPGDVRPIDDLTETATATPTSSGDQPSADPGPVESSATPAPTPQASQEDAGNTGLWIGLGIGAAVLVGAAIAVPVLRSRRG
ncbi:type VII secretion-associated serine protease mycosin [Streptomyces tanashiensis]|uniref:type VII secretion-associated serine protease mycosin n=1 Tax=Streptomyces tanashiensis TaxID=67367 RepID=UPI0036AC0051